MSMVFATSKKGKGKGKSNENLANLESRISFSGLLVETLGE